jgi:RHS repeat-associated protein
MGTTTYFYDAEGRRNAKAVGSTVSEEYVYDQEGHIVSVYGPYPSQTWLRDEIYAGNRHVATYANGTTYFTHADGLGTERARTGMTGSVCGSAVSQPFGDNAFFSGCFAESPNFFTGKQTDPESGLDYFGARFDANRFYRFLTPDPGGLSAVDPSDPQTWNMYAYVRNNPTTKTDPTGLYTVACSSDAKQCEKDQENFEKQRQKDLESKDVEVQNAAKAWGNFGDTGVTVTFKSQAEVDADAGNSDPSRVQVGAFTTPGITKEDFGDMRFRNDEAEFSTSLSGSDLQQAIAHEGSHLEDIDAFENSFNPSTGRYNPALDQTTFTTELKAFTVGSHVQPYTMFPTGPKGYQQMVDFIRTHYKYLDLTIFPPSMFPR